MSDSQPDLFEKQVSVMAGEEVSLDFELLEQEHRDSYLRHAINATTLVDTAINLLEQARRNYNQAARVAAIHKNEEGHAHVDAALFNLDAALTATKKILK